MVLTGIFNITGNYAEWIIGLPLNAKYPGGIEAQKEKLEAEGYTIIQKGCTNIKFLWVGNKCLIKCHLFDQYIEQAFSIVIKNNNIYIENMTILLYNISEHEKGFLKGE